MKPASTFTAAAIAELAFKKSIESSADELAQKFTEGAIAKINQLRQQIVEKLQGKPRVAAAIALIETGSKAELEQLVPYLRIAMDEDEGFAQDIQRSTHEILQLTRVEGRNVQNIYGGQRFQVNDSTAPVIQGTAMQQFSIEEMRERSQDVLETATSEPVILVNQSQPSYVLLSVQNYQQLIDRLTELEDHALGQLAELALQHSSMLGTEIFVTELQQIAALNESDS